MRENISESLYSDICRERQDEAGQAGLGLASVNSFSGLSGIEDVFSCLIPAAGVTRTGYKSPEWKSPVQEWLVV